jgi:putative transposase
MRYRFIHEHRHRWPVLLLCKVLDVSRSAFYAWRSRPESKQTRRRRELAGLIRVVHQGNRQTYGSPRIQQELVARGRKCSVNLVAKIMKQERIAAKTKRKFKATTRSRHRHPVAENLLERRFEQTAPNQAWVSDITYVATRQGWLYLAVVMDLYSRRIVGWATARSLSSRLVVDALQRAIQTRQPPRGLLLHSDRGCQYASDHYQHVLNRHGIRCSMSRKANCWDNAVIESFFRTLKTELVYWEDFHSPEQATRSLFEYIECFYNARRRHSTLGYLSPVDYEQKVA